MDVFSYLHNVAVRYGEDEYLRRLTYTIDYWYVEDRELIKEIDFNLKNMLRWEQ